MGNGQAVPQQMVGLFQTAFQYRRVWTSGPLLIFARELDGQLLTTVVNAADVSQALSLPWSAPPARDLLTGQRLIPTDNAIPLTLPPRSGLLLQTDLP